MANLQPLNDRVIVKREDPAKQTASGIFIPGGEESSIAVVVAVGPGKVLENGSRAPMTVAVGQKVLLGKYAGTQTKIDGEEVIVMREDEILAILG
jgi:chaperonin GroES